MRFATLCSGIEACSVAWHPLGWQCAFTSEIDAFPSAVLRHHWPETPNLGDMLKITEGTLDGYAGSIDLVCAGTPCQSFSVAGLRAGLTDPRGNLALRYFQICAYLRPRWIVWENVAGVLSAGGGADFRSILAAVTECGYGWAYRILDAQHFGVPQRRRRIILVGYLGDWRPAAAVLFERDSLRGHLAAGAEAGQEIAGSLGSLSETGGFRTSDLDGQGAFIPMAFDGHQITSPDNRTRVAPGLPAPTLHRKAEINIAACEKADTLTVGANQTYGRPGDIVGYAPSKAHTLRAEGHDASEDGTGRGSHLVTGTLAANGRRAEVVPTLTACGGPGEGTRYDKHPLVCNCHGHTIGLTAADHSGVNRETPLVVGGGSCPTVSEEHPALTTRKGDQTGVMCFAPRVARNGRGAPADTVPSLGAEMGATGKGDAAPCVAGGNEHRVRRLTPREWERLMGFPDDYTLIPWRGGMAPDSPRYKALGNSKAIPVVRWVGERIALVEEIMAELAQGEHPKSQ